MSCICLTCGRPELLEETIQSFLLQEHPGHKELIVLNEFDQQRLMFEHPEVHVLNFPAASRTVGEKANAEVALGRARHALRLGLRRRLAAPSAEVVGRAVRPAQGLLQTDPGRLLERRPAQRAGGERVPRGSCWSRKLFMSMRGYAAMDTGYDQEIEARLTGWRIRLREIARSPAWKWLENARQERRSAPAIVQARVSKGLAVSIYELNGLLPTGHVRGVHRNMPAGQVDVLPRGRLGQEFEWTCCVWIPIPGTSLYRRVCPRVANSPCRCQGSRRESCT